MKSLALLIFFLSGVLFTYSEESQTNNPILFIIDASSSMLNQINGKSRMQIAFDVISNAVHKLPDNQKIGLMVYGNQKKEDCEDAEFLVGLDNRNKEKIINSLATVTPLGITPLTYSISLAFGELRKFKVPTTIILITDSIESCGGNIYNEVTKVKKEGIKFRLHIVAFGLKEVETKILRQAATAGSGNYYYALDEKGLEETLGETFKHTVDKPKNNVTVYTVKDGKPIDAWVNAYDLISSQDPISVRTYGDTTSFYLPPSYYNFKVTTLDGNNEKTFTVPNIQSFENLVIHKDINLVSEKIAVTTTNNGENWDCIVKVNTLSGNVVASVRTYQQPKKLEVNPGTYNISIQALAMEGTHTYTEIKNVTITKGTKYVSYNFSTGKMILNTFAEDKSIDCILMVSEANSGKNISVERTYGHEMEFLLNPGRYDVKAVPIGNYNDRGSQTITIDIVEGETTNKKLIFNKKKLLESDS